MLATLDIAIGLVLVFTLVSLVCSVLNEWVSGILGRRGKLLWDGIEKMLGKELSDQLRKHHLIQSLVQKSLFDRLIGWLVDREKPAYVPTETFALALLDVLGGRAAAATDNAAALRAYLMTLPADANRGQLLNLLDLHARAAAAAPANVAALRDYVMNLPADANRDQLLNLLDIQEQVAALRTYVAALPAGANRGQLLNLLDIQAQAVAAAAANAAVGGAMPRNLGDLSNGIGTLLPASIRNGLLSLVTAAGTATGTATVTVAGAPAPVVSQLEVAKKNIGQWYDDAMDRVTGAYKRWSQVVLLVLGFAVATLLGVDSIQIAKALQADPTLRAAAVKAAQAFVDDQRKQGANKEKGTPATGSKAQETNTGASGASAGASGASAGASAAKPGAPAAKPGAPASGNNTPAAPTSPSIEDVRKQLSDLRDKLAGLDIPLSPVTERGDATPWDWFWCHFAGFLLTALAASLGAPFWFDLLNRFVNLRAAGKKPEPQKATSSPT